MLIIESISSTIKNTLLLAFVSFAIFNISAQEQPASLVLKESFGSDPYGLMAYHNGTIVVAGKDGAGSPNASRFLDILQYSDAGFELTSQFQLPRSTDNSLLTGTLDLTYHNGYWQLLVSSESSYHLMSMSLFDGKLSIIDELAINIPNDRVKLVAGSSENLYLVSSESSLAVTHFKITSNGSIEKKSKVLFGIAPNEPSYQDDFSISYDNQALYLTSNQDNSPAKLYKLPVTNDGTPQEAEKLSLENARSSYHTSKVSGDLWFLSYHFWGFQVARIEDNTLNIIYEFDENSSYTSIEVKDNFIFGIDTFNSIDVFEIADDGTITHSSKLETKGFIGDAHLADEQIFFTRGWNGIEVVKIKDDASLISLNSFNQSGQVIDMAMHENELAIAALDKNLHFWTIDEAKPASLNATFNTLNNIQGVEWNGDEIVINSDAQFESHLAGNLKNNIDVGVQYDILGSSGRDGQVIKLENGYLSQSFTQLNFIDESNNLVTTIHFESCNTLSCVQEIVASNNLLFVPLLSPSEVVIYDTSELSNIVEVSRITRQGSLQGNVAVKNNYLYVPVVLRNGNIGITPYDITNPSNPIELLSVTFDGINTATLHIDGDFLIAIGDKGALFDITNPEKPMLVDTNPNISTNGIALGVGRDLFTASKYSSGHLHRSQINLAPQQDDLSMNLLEDGQATIALSATDNENDDVTYSILGKPVKGSLSVQDNTTLLYEGTSNDNGADIAQLLVVDTHGGSSQFNVAINITPVNDAPILETSEINAIEDTPANVMLSASDIDSDTLIFSIITPPKFGIVELNKEGAITYLAKSNYDGDDTIEVQVTDNEDALDSKTIAINISPVNDAPMFTGKTKSQGNEDYNLTFELSANDIDGDDVTFELISTPNGWSGNLKENNLVLTPKANDNGDFSVVIAMQDGKSTTKQTLIATLAAVNDAPTFDDTPLNILVTSNQSQTAALTATDVDNDPLKFEVSEQATKGNAMVNEKGIIIYTAEATKTGTDNFIVTVTDAAGATANKTVSVNISTPTAPRTNESGGGSLSWLYLLALTFTASQRHRVNLST